jgi:hypothetical protein
MFGNLIAVFAAVVLCGAAQEVDPHDPTIIAERLDRADAIVLGSFQVKPCLPWFDGWHCGGAIQVRESLHGPWKSNEAVQFRWKEHYGNVCFICEKVSEFGGQQGIWFLTNKNGAWQFTSTAALWCGGPFSIKDRDVIVRLLRDKTRNADQLH